jgi:hypothetical protein
MLPRSNGSVPYVGNRQALNDFISDATSACRLQLITDFFTFPRQGEKTSHFFLKFLSYRFV